MNLSIRKIYIYSFILMANLYIIGGCNGAGKTTASYTILPEMLNCKEFVNADSIASGLSPFKPESVAFEAGRIMLNRINELINEKIDFGFETTLSAKSYISLINMARQSGYEITLLYFWLSSPEFAMSRVEERVKKGGHNIANDIIVRRYYRGISNLLKLYIPACDYWIIIDNTDAVSEVVAQGSLNAEKVIKKDDIWNIIIKQSTINE
jgi:predicted ABC-type ATPase